MAPQESAISLLHLVNGHSANVGNGALTEGAESVLNEDVQRPIVWSREAWDDYTFGLKPFDRKFVALINDRSDGMIVGGAVDQRNELTVKWLETERVIIPSLA